MPENRFGGVNPQPLYNVTGRMNRGEAPQAPQFQPMNAGAQKNFGAGDMPNNAAGSGVGFGANMMNQIGWQNGWQVSARGMRPRGRGGWLKGRGSKSGVAGNATTAGDGGGDGDTNSNNTTFVGGGFGEGSGNTYNQQGLGGQNFNAFNNNSSQPAMQPQQGEKPKRVVTPAQKASRASRDQQNKSGARTPVARGPRQKPAVAGATNYSGSTSAPTVQANNTDARQVSNYAGASTPPATQQGPGQPGAPAISFGSVTGAALGNPAKIASSKVGKK
jgi:hypothetical protein